MSVNYTYDLVQGSITLSGTSEAPTLPAGSENFRAIQVVFMSTSRFVWSSDGGTTFNEWPANVPLALPVQDAQNIEVKQDTAPGTVYWHLFGNNEGRRL